MAMSKSRHDKDFIKVFANSEKSACTSDQSLSAHLSVAMNSKLVLSDNKHSDYIARMRGLNCVFTRNASHFVSLSLCFGSIL